MNSKKMNKIAMLAFVPFTLAMANNVECKKDTSYFLKNFAKSQNPESFNLQWAKCEEKLGNKDEAMSAYERVLLVNPDNVEAATKLAKYYKNNNMKYESNELKQTVDNSRLSPEQRQIVSSLLKDETDLVSTRISARVDFGYDDNLNFGIYANPAQSGEEKSAFHAFTFSSNYVNELDEAGGFSFQSNLNFYWQDNYSNHYYDTVYGSIDAGLGYSTSTMLLYIPFVYRRMGYLDTDLYEQYGVAPRLTVTLDEELLLNLEVSYLKRNHKDTLYVNADDTLTNASVGLYRFFGDNYIYAQVKYNHFNADSLTPTLFTEHDYFQLFAGASYEIENFAIAGINYQYGHGTYSDLMPNTNIEREDDFNQVNLSLQRGFTDNLKVIANYTYSNNESNYNMAAYDKQTVTVGLQYDY
jgi:hypothetical protein